MTNLAHAMGQFGGGGGAKGPDVQVIVMMAVIFAIFFFLLIRPQQKKQKEMREMLKNIKHGDTIVTTGGLYGKVTGITENIITLEISDKVRVRVAKNNVAVVTEKADK
ncbi:MAG: preprotein translocase subunit YajC [Syntrophales bacterium]|nr:preprotein translocase subunit YajC [Syntrophales bacterium]